MSIAEILARLSMIARADMGDFIDDQGQFNVQRIVEQSYVIKRVRFVGRGEKRRVVSVELHDKRTALIMLARYYRLL